MAVTKSFNVPVWTDALYGCPNQLQFYYIDIYIKARGPCSLRPSYLSPCFLAKDL